MPQWERLELRVKLLTSLCDYSGHVVTLSKPASIYV